MPQGVHSQLALGTLFKLRRCAEGWFAREWTCWKPDSKTPERTFSDWRPPIPRTLCNTASGRNDAARNRVPFFTSAGYTRATGRLFLIDDD